MKNKWLEDEIALMEATLTAGKIRDKVEPENIVQDKEYKCVECGREFKAIESINCPRCYSGVLREIKK